MKKEESVFKKSVLKHQKWKPFITLFNCIPRNIGLFLTKISIVTNLKEIQVWENKKAHNKLTNNSNVYTWLLLKSVKMEDRYIESLSRKCHLNFMNDLNLTCIENIKPKWNLEFFLLFLILMNNKICGNSIRNCQLIYIIKDSPAE
jgi:hypothetical protein